MQKGSSIMKNSSFSFIIAAVAAIYFCLSGSVSAVPTPPTVNVPDGGSTVLLLGAVLGGISFVRWQLHR